MKYEVNEAPCIVCRAPTKTFYGYPGVFYCDFHAWKAYELGPNLKPRKRPRKLW